MQSNNTSHITSCNQRPSAKLFEVTSAPSFEGPWVLRDVQGTTIHLTTKHIFDRNHQEATEDPLYSRVLCRCVHHRPSQPSLKIYSADCSIISRCERYARDSRYWTPSTYSGILSSWALWKLVLRSGNRWWYNYRTGTVISFPGKASRLGNRRVSLCSWVFTW